MRTFTRLLPAILLAACASAVIETEVPFDPAEAAFIERQGSATISGQAFMRQLGGGVVTCAGENVNLIPATAYAQARIAGIYGSSEGGRRAAISPISTDNVPSDYLRLARSSVCDAEGDFVFTNVADGDYYVTTSVVWVVPGGYFPEGGALATRAQVRGGRDVSVILN